MEREQRECAEQLHALLASGPVEPAAFRAALLGVPASERDAWLDVVFGLEEEVGVDGPQLPPNCTPYLPCPVSAVLGALQLAQPCSSDVFVDIGSGLGRAALLARLFSGVSAVGLEIQPALAEASRVLARRLHVSRFTVIEGDAPQLIPRLTQGSVFFLYCPFAGERLEQVLDGLAGIARARPIHVCAVQLPPLERPWLVPLDLPEGELAIYRSAGTR